MLALPRLLATAALFCAGACVGGALRDGGLAEKLRRALASGDTLQIFRVARDTYHQAGAEFDRGLALELQGPDTLSSYYREDSNRIVLARGARAGAWPPQLRALSAALRFTLRDGFPDGLGVEGATRFVNLLVLLFAAHEQAHYLRAQYLAPRQDDDPFGAEEMANRIAVSLLRELAERDASLEHELQAMRALLEQILAAAAPAVTRYPPQGERAPAWFNRYYRLLLEHEPGVYFVFQVRWWLRFLRAPREPFVPLVEREILSHARRALAHVQTPRGTHVRVRTTPTRVSRLPSEILAIGPRGEVLVDADGRLLRHEGRAVRTYVAPALPYGDGHRSNYATWPPGDRVFAMRYEAPETLALFAIDLDDSRGCATPTAIGRFALGERPKTLSHDPDGRLYVLAESDREIAVYRIEPPPRGATLPANALHPWRRFARRPAGHRDGPLSEASFDVAAFTVLSNGSLVFADGTAHALRTIDSSGQVATLFGSLRGKRDGGASARVTHASHLAANGDGFLFLESHEREGVVRGVELRPKRGRW